MVPWGKAATDASEESTASPGKGRQYEVTKTAQEQAQEQVAAIADQSSEINVALLARAPHRHRLRVLLSGARLGCARIGAASF